MCSLHELQTRIMGALLGGPVDPALALIDSTDVPAARLDVYRNTIRHNFVEALRSTYPAISRLVGEDYFRRTVHRFAAEHPSRSGDLLHAGDGFAAFLSQLHAHDEFAYLGDVALLEWLIQDSSLAQRHLPLDLTRMAQLSPSDYDDLRFLLHPSLRLFESRYPARRIWQANVDIDADPETIDLTQGGDRLAVLRHRLRLQFHGLTRGEWELLRAMTRGATFVVAIEAASASDEGFDASAALRRLVAAEAIVDF